MNGNILKDYSEAYEKAEVTKLNSGQYLFKYRYHKFLMPAGVSISLNADYTVEHYYKVRNNLHSPFYNTAFEDFEPPDYNGGLMMVEHKNRLGYIDLLGNEVWKQVQVSDTALHPFNLTFNATATWSLQGHTIDETYSGNKFKAKEPGLGVEVKKENLRYGNIVAYTVTLYNYSSYTVDTIRTTENILVIPEIMDNGFWCQFESMPNDFHNFPSQELKLVPGRSRTFNYPIYVGTKKVKMRLKLYSGIESISEPFDASINPSQLLNKEWIPKSRLVDRFLNKGIGKGKINACYRD